MKRRRALLLFTGLAASLDVGATLAGPLTVEARGVARWDGAAFTIELDGSAEGIPPGVRIEAVSRNSDEASTDTLTARFLSLYHKPPYSQAGNWSPGTGGRRLRS